MKYSRMDTGNAAFVALIFEWQWGLISLDTVMWRSGYDRVDNFLKAVKSITVPEKNEHNLRGSGMISGNEPEFYKLFERKK